MHLLQSLTACALLTGALALTGCGSSNNASNSPAQTTGGDAQATSAASSAVGLASDAGLNQLYNKGVAAFREAPRSTIVNDGPRPVNEIIFCLNNTPPSPAIGSSVITTTAYPSPIYTSGQIQFEADSTGLPADWYHISLSFTSGNPFVVTNEEGDVITIDSGSFELYVSDPGAVGSGTPGDWTDTIDCYAYIAQSAPITAVVQLASGGTRTTSLSGLRHVKRAITRSITGTTVTRADNVTIDGDYSNLSGIVTPTIVSGPSLADRNGTIHPFTMWQHTTTLADGLVHTFLWDRHCTYSVTYTYQQGSPTWIGTIANYYENVYIQKDDLPQIGPLSDIKLALDYGIIIDMNRGAALY
jgi:hypothetical protein